MECFCVSLFPRLSKSGRFEVLSEKSVCHSLDEMAHQRSRCSHEENRYKVCATCGQKIVVGRKKLKDFHVSSKISGLIKKHVNDNFCLTSPQYPASTCTTCSLTLYEWEKDIKKRPALTMPNYEDITLPRKTTALDKVECLCYICMTARSLAHRKSITGRGHTRKPIKRLEPHDGIHGLLPKTMEDLKINSGSVLIPTKKAQMKKNALKICKDCFQELAKGKRHPCVSRKKNVPTDNVVQILNKLTEKKKLQVVSSILDQKIDEKLTAGEFNSAQGVKLCLNTGGSKKTICVNPEKEKKVLFPLDSFANFKTNTGSSYNAMKKFITFVRHHSGKKSVPSFAIQNISKQGKILEEFYQAEVFDFDITGHNSVQEKRPCVWTDAEKMVEAVVTAREIIGNYTIKVMADGGQGFFKICFSVLPESDLELECSHHDYETETERNKANFAGSKGKCTSVNRIILLCLVPDIKENYNNLQFLFDLIKINNIAFRFVSDFKVLLLVNGQQTATSSFPCPYCYVSLHQLRNPDTHDDKPLNLKTYGDLKKDYDKFCSLKNNMKKAKDCFSTVNPPIFQEDDSTYILEKCIVPELHILQGFVNHLFWDGLVPLLGRDTALLWPQKFNLVHKGYHGDVFEGNACRRLLKEADKLNSPEILVKVDELQLLPFVRAMKAMNKIVECSFSTQKVGPELGKNVEELNSVFKATGLTKTLKIHVTLEHLLQCIQFVNGNGLGMWSEQAGESIHREFMKFWDKYKINALNSPQYLSRLKTAVVEFSSSHL